MLKGAGALGQECKPNFLCWIPTLEQEQKIEEPAVATGGPAQSAEEIDMAVEDMSPENVSVPTPMKDAMATNTMAPLGTLTDQNTGLMSNTTQQIAPIDTESFSKAPEHFKRA